MTNQRFITILGYVATFTSVCMYVSYLQQIGPKFIGSKGGWLQPFHDDQLVCGWLMVC